MWFDLGCRSRTVVFIKAAAKPRLRTLMERSIKLGGAALVPDKPPPRRAEGVPMGDSPRPTLFFSFSLISH